MVKRKFKKGKPVLDAITSKRDERLFETEYWKKIAKVINKLKKGLKKWQE
jgi:hypothetical protein